MNGTAIGMSDRSSGEPRRLGWTLIPVVVFGFLALVFWKGLWGNPSELPSTLINRPAPQFTLPGIEGLDQAPLTSADLAKGEPTVVNIWASWCAPCRDEHPLLMELAGQGIRIVGINNKDQPEDARRFLGTLGNPFALIGADRDGRVTIDWGGYGVPETFVVDGNGIIRHKIIGPLSPEIIKTQLMPELEKAGKN
jgi:cytochrome c biogenesis protein CcmG, thiol:disulfide interchange protein DsbE